jgi:hypothetical protein
MIKEYLCIVYLCCGPSCHERHCVCLCVCVCVCVSLSLSLSLSFSLSLLSLSLSCPSCHDRHRHNIHLLAHISRTRTHTHTYTHTHTHTHTHTRSESCLDSSRQTNNTRTTRLQNDMLTRKHVCMHTRTPAENTSTCIHMHTPSNTCTCSPILPPTLRRGFACGGRVELSFFAP